MTSLSRGYSLNLIALISLIFGGRWGIPSGFDGPDGGAGRFLGVSEFFGIETRWGGPFGSVNYLTPVGGLLLLLGVVYSRWNRWIFVSMAVVILFLGQARTTYFALAIAILVLILWSHRFSAIRHAGVIRWFSVASASVAVFAYIFVVDSTFNGRTPIWVDYWSEVSASLIPGIGSSGVTEYVA